MNTTKRTVLSTLKAGLLVLIGALAGPTLVSAETIALIGTGNVGGALGPAFGKLGHDIIYGSREPTRADVQELVARTGGKATAMLPAEAAAAADIVVMATKWAQAEVALKSLGDLSGKIILDPNNAVRVDEAGMRHLGVETSAAEIDPSVGAERQGGEGIQYAELRDNGEPHQRRRPNDYSDRGE